MPVTNLRITVERIHYDESTRRALLLVPEATAAPTVPPLFELCLDSSDCKRFGNRLRLTKPGDVVRLTTRSSCNGVESLAEFANESFDRMV